MTMSTGACSLSFLVTLSAACPTTTTVRSIGSSASASRTYSSMARPHRRWRGFGRDERIRDPSPAASTTAEIGRWLMRPFYLLPLAVHDIRDHRPHGMRSKARYRDGTRSGVVQVAGQQTLDLRIGVRVLAPEPSAGF